MSHNNRWRNTCDFHARQQETTRRQNSDLFERDPFKIQSYNFRYAEKRSTQNPVNRNNNNNNRSNGGQTLQTYFYNHGFTPAQYDKANPPDKFYEQRRRKFLGDSKQVKALLQPLAQPQTRFRQQNPYADATKSHQQRAAAAPPPRACTENWRRECQPRLRPLGTNARNATGNRRRTPSPPQWESSPSITSSSSSRCSLATRLLNSHSNLQQRQAVPRARGSVSTTLLNVRTPSKNMVGRGGGSHTVEAKNSSTSGCLININIKGLDEFNSSENVTIEIESDRHKFNPVQTAQLRRSPSYTPPMSKKAPELPRKPSYTMHASASNQKVPTKTDSERTYVINANRSRQSLHGAANSRTRMSDNQANASSSKVRLPSLISWNIERPSATNVREQKEVPLKRSASNRCELKNLQQGGRNLEPARSRRDLSNLARSTEAATGHKRQPPSNVSRSCMNLNLRLKPEVTSSKTNGLTESRESRQGRPGARQMSFGVPSSYKRSPSPVNVNINVYADNARLLHA